MREVICGPFHSGHREQWAANIREEVRAGRADSFLYLVPTRGLAGVVRELILDGLPGAAGEQVLTIFEVVEEVLAKSDRSYIRLDTLTAERLVAKVMRHLDVNWNGQGLAEWSHSPGVVAAFRQHIGELKRAMVDPQTLIRHVEGTPNEETVRVLSAVYTAYQQELSRGEYLLLDTEETYLEAARVLERLGLQTVFPGVEQIYIDSFTDFIPHQMTVVQQLLKVEHVQMYLPYQIDRWEWMESLAAQMRKTIHDYFKETLHIRYVEEEADVEVQEDIRLLQSRLFAPHPEPLSESPHVDVFAARTEEKEWLRVAKKIKQLHQMGVGLSDMAILTNRQLQINSTAYRVLKREGIPVTQSASLFADQVPWVRDLLTLYTLDDRIWHRDVLQQLAGAEWLTEDSPLQGREMIIPRIATGLGVVKGLYMWQKRLGDRLQSPYLKDEQERADLHALREWLLGLQAKVSDLPDNAPSLTHVEALRSLLPDGTFYDRVALKFREEAGYSAEYLQRDLRARDALEHVLQALEKMEPLLGEEGALSRIEFAQLLNNHLQQEELVVSRGKRTGVAFVTPSAARGLSFAHVFLVGLNEGEWPTTARTSWLLRETLREELASTVPLLAPQLQFDQQKLFFLMGIHTARDGIWASYVSASKQDLPSRYLDELYELCPHLRGKEKEVTDGYLGGSALYPEQGADISNEREARDWLAAQLEKGKLTEEALWLVEPDFWKQVLDQATSEQERATAHGVSRFDGVLEAEAIRGELAERYSTDRVYSVSQFNRYGECGYKFFLSRVLNIDAEQEEEEELSALEKGNLYHKVLYRLYGQLTNEPRVTAELIEKLRAELPQVFEAEWNRAQRGRQTEVGARQLLERDRLLRRLSDWFEGEAEAWQSQGLPLVPRFLEWVFGMESDENNDPQSRREPVQVGGLKFRGQIDRIDATTGGQFMVVDYKSKGTKPMPKAIENGVDFQLPVYLRAVEQALFEGTGEMVGAAYYSIEKVDRTSSALVKASYMEALGMGKKRNKLDDEQWQDLLTHAEKTLALYRGQMADGHFPVVPHDPAVCSFCEYRKVCRYDRIRALSREVQTTNESRGVLPL